MQYLDLKVSLTVLSFHFSGYPKTLRVQGIDVNHLPILEKVLKKYGDVVSGSAFHSSACKTMAWTYLAEILRILQQNSGNTLTDDQARDLSKALYDLREVMKLKVEWLEPFVEKNFDNSQQ